MQISFLPPHCLLACWRQGGQPCWSAAHSTLVEIRYIQHGDAYMRSLLQILTGVQPSCFGAQGHDCQPRADVARRGLRPLPEQIVRRHVSVAVPQLVQPLAAPPCVAGQVAA